jgi:hypothetical protein
MGNVFAKADPDVRGFEEERFYINVALRKKARAEVTEQLQEWISYEECDDENQGLRSKVAALLLCLLHSPPPIVDGTNRAEVDRVTHILKQCHTYNNVKWFISGSPNASNILTAFMAAEPLPTED